AYERAPEMNRTSLGPLRESTMNHTTRPDASGHNGPVLTATGVWIAPGCKVSRASSGGAAWGSSWRPVTAIQLQDACSIDLPDSEEELGQGKTSSFRSVFRSTRRSEPQYHSSFVCQDGAVMAG